MENEPLHHPPQSSSFTLAQEQQEAGELELKKLKMPITSDDDEDNDTTTDIATLQDGPTPQIKPRYRRRKVAIFFAYCGVGYQGMQKNPGAKTIEGDFQEALFHSGAIPDHDRGCPRRFGWTRSARTDKGVSAVGQVVSGRFYVDPPGLVQRLNSLLPPQIMVFGYKRVTGAFNAQKFCIRRRYVYLIPVFALDPSRHCDRESILASLGSENELVKCMECSERGRKVEGTMGRRNLDSKTNGFLSNVTSEDLQNGASEIERIEDENQEEVKVVRKSEFCYGDEERVRFNRILKYYQGTHNFHNFTASRKAEDPAALRYIISFEANTTVNIEGFDFVKCEVVGQSFMLHQIRKMIGLAVAIMRNIAPESLMGTAFRQDVNINVPLAPEVGLYLDECFFSSYNEKWKDSHEELSMQTYAEEAEDFKMQYIYSHIASTEHKEGVVALWLHSLNHCNYADLQFVQDGINTDAESLKLELQVRWQ